MKFVYSPHYEVDIGRHVFPTSKYRLVREKLLSEGVASPDSFLEPAPAPREQLELVHSPEMLDDLEHLRATPRTRYSELPLSTPIVQAYVIAAGGTVEAARRALESPEKVCVHIGGGFHHAFGDKAEGFCYINDIAVGIRVMEREGRIGRSMVVDLDLHQGNGTAHIFQDDPDVFTISLHQQHNYPFKQRSDIDVGLDDGTGDGEYLRRLREAYLPALDYHLPELLIYVAGADPYMHDQLGGLMLSLDGLRQRDELVLREAARRHIPSVVVFAGGYARRLEDTVEIHAQTCRTAAALTIG